MYAVKMVITDTKTTVTRPYKTEMTESVFRSEAGFDLYIDLFDTYERANSFYMSNCDC